jgi:hypothetical protein
MSLWRQALDNPTSARSYSCLVDDLANKRDWILFRVGLNLDR